MPIQSNRPAAPLTVDRRRCDTRHAGTVWMNMLPIERKALLITLRQRVSPMADWCDLLPDEQNRITEALHARGDLSW